MELTIEGVIEMVSEEKEWDELPDCEEDAERCPKCSGKMCQEVISSDADGNREELGWVCPECD